MTEHAQGGDYRRRRRRDVDRVPPRRAGLDRHRAGRACGADLGLHVPQRRAGRAAAEHGDADADDDVRGRALPAAGRGDRGGPVVARGGVTATRLEPGPPRGAPAAGRLGGELRAADRARHRVRGARPVPADDDRGRAGRGVAAHRRLARPVEPRVRVGGGRPQARRASAAAPSREWHRRSRRAGDRRGSAARRRAVRHRGGGRRQRGRHVRARDRPDGGDHAADHPDGPPVPADGADRGRRARPAAAARPGQPRLLPRGGRRPVHGRLRAQPDALGPRWRPAGLQPPPARSRLAAVRGDHGRGHPPGPRDRRRAGHPDDQRPRGLHARQRVHPRRVGRPWAVRGGRVLRPRDRRRRGHRPPGGVVDRRRRARARPVEDGHPPVRGAVPEPRLHARAQLRELRHLLRHPLPERGAPGRAGPSASPRRIRGSRSSASSFGEKSSWERANWFEPNAGGAGVADGVDLEALRPRGWAGEHWSPAIGAEAIATRTTAGAVRRDLVRQDRARRAGGGGPAATAVRERRRPRGREHHVHAAAQPPRRHRVRPHGHAGHPRSIPARDRDGVRQPRPRLDSGATPRPTGA